MNTIEKKCEELLNSFDKHNHFTFEKKANTTNQKVVTIPSNVNLQKVASEIRTALQPVELTYDDVNNFISEIS